MKPTKPVRKLSQLYAQTQEPDELTFEAQEVIEEEQEGGELFEEEQYQSRRFSGTGGLRSSVNSIVQHFFSNRKNTVGRL